MVRYIFRSTTCRVIACLHCVDAGPKVSFVPFPVTCVCSLFPEQVLGERPFQVFFQWYPIETGLKTEGCLPVSGPFLILSSIKVWISQRHIPEQKPGSRTEPFSIHLECNCYLTPNIKRAACREGETSWPLSYFLTRTEGPSSYIDIPLENKRSAARSSFRELMQRRRGRERERERHKSTKQLQLCTCITLFCTFLCCCFTTTTWNHLVSRFMEGSELKTTIFVFFFWI